MKNLYKKICVVVLSGALLIGGVFASSKIDIHASGIALNELSYKYKFDVIDDKYDNEDDINKDVSDFGAYYGVDSVEQVQNINYSIFVEQVKNKSLGIGMYFVIDGESKALVGIKK